MQMLKAELPYTEVLGVTVLTSLKDAKPDDPVVAGVKLIVEQLEKLLRDHGVSPIESVGQPFDPMLHEALMHDRQSKLPAGTVAQELERGYKLHDRVLRHAKVAVAAEEAPAALESPPN